MKIGIFNKLISGIFSGIACIFLLAPTDSFAAKVNSIDEIYRILKAKNVVQVDFRQTVFTASLNRRSEAAGKLTYSFPGKSRWDYRVPEEHTVIISEEEFLLIDPALESVTVGRLRGNVSDTAMLFLSGDPASTALYQKIARPDKTLLSCRDSELYYRPVTDTDSIKEIQICFVPSQSFFHSLAVIEKNGNYRVFTFDNPVFSQPDPSVFSYDIPENWEIIRE